MELRARTNAHAFPAEIEQEKQRQERSTLDELDGDAQVIDTELGKEQEKRAEWLKLPHTARASTRKARQAQPQAED
eukprot:9861517-Heterocapsa_arctica.AAC.1